MIYYVNLFVFVISMKLGNILFVCLGKLDRIGILFDLCKNYFYYIDMLLLLFIDWGKFYKLKMNDDKILVGINLKKMYVNFFDVMDFKNWL